VSKLEKIWKKMGGKNICHLRKFLKGVENFVSKFGKERVGKIFVI